MKQIRLYDGSFSSHQLSATLGGENCERGPTHFEWSEDADSEYTFITDMYLKDAHQLEGEKKVAWLLEPPSLSNTHYSAAVIHRHVFDYVISFHRQFLDSGFGKRGLGYPLGGSWIAPENQGIKEKSRDVCIIVSEKTKAQGHKMRHKIVRELAEEFSIDVYGRGYKPFPEKSRVLWPYRYAIIVESWNGYFSEKLIDALSMGCVPIYWGDASVNRIFNPNGILSFFTYDMLISTLSQTIGREDYEQRMPAIKENFELCKQYQCAEDWMYQNYGFLFT